MQDGPKYPRHLKKWNDEDAVEHFEGGVHAAEPEDHQQKPQDQHDPGKRAKELVISPHCLAQQLRQAFSLENALWVSVVWRSFGGSVKGTGIFTFIFSTYTHTMHEGLTKVPTMALAIA